MIRIGVCVNLLGDNIDTMKENTETLIDASKEVGLEINVEKTKYMLLSCHQNVGRNPEIKIGNRSFENVSELKYLGTTVTNQNLIQEEIYMSLSCHQIIGRNPEIKIGNRSFGNVSELKYMETTVTNKNLIQEETKRRSNSGIAYYTYHSVQNLLSSHLLSKNLKIRIFKTIILSVVPYGCETSSLTLREEHRLRVRTGC
jgi:hypothetical protein